MTENPDETRTERSAADTRLEGAGTPSGPTETRVEGGDPGGYVRVNLPPELAPRYRVVRGLTSGGESDVLLVERVADDEGAPPVVLKLYRHGRQPDPTALDRIRSLPAAHVVEIYDTGPSAAGWWEEQEYVPHGSLADLIRDRGPKLPYPLLMMVIDELTQALDAIHDAIHTVLHRDVKPANVLVRSLDPLDLVLSDFGLARSVDQSNIVSRVMGSLAYESPEAQIGGASIGRDWWAFGMIVAEAAGGHHPFYDPTLGWTPEAEMRIALATRPVPLDDVENERVRLLCRGLLVRDPDERWGAEEVRAWLGGGSPPVASELVAAAAVAAPIQPFVFAGERCAAPAALAVPLARHWNEAVELLSGAASEAPDYVRLHVWLEDHEDAAALRVLSDVQDRSFSRRLFRLLRALDPALPPSFRGEVIDRDGLVALARRGSAGDAAAGATLFELQQLAIVGELAREDAFSALAPVDDGWRAQMRLLPSLRASMGAAGAPLDEVATQHAVCSRILLALLDPEEAGRLSDQVRSEREALAVPPSDARVQRLAELIGDGRTPARSVAALLAIEAVSEELAAEAQARTREVAAAAVRDAEEIARRAGEQQARRRRIRGAAMVAGALVVGGIAGGVLFSRRYHHGGALDLYRAVELIAYGVIPLFVGLSLPRRRRGRHGPFTWCVLAGFAAWFYAYRYGLQYESRTVPQELAYFVVPTLVFWVLPFNRNRRTPTSPTGLGLFVCVAAAIVYVLAYRHDYGYWLSLPAWFWS